MSRPRSKSNAWMRDFPGLYLLRGRYVVRLSGTQIQLCDGATDRQEVIAAYINLPKEQKAHDTLADVLALYSASAQFLKLSRVTQKDALKAYKVVTHTKTKSGAEFGSVSARALTIVTIRKYMDKRGETSETRADRELAYMSMAFTWAVERGVMDTNPCIGVRRFNPRHRQRYITDEEYAERAALAEAHGRLDVIAAMELAYLCRLRINEVVKLLDSPAVIMPTGVLAKRGKGSKTQIIEWTPRLEAAIALARTVPRRQSSMKLLVSVKTGLPLSQRALSDAWNDLKHAAKTLGHATDYTFHDLKAKGVSDAPGDKHVASGHKTQRMTEVYDRVFGKAPSTR